MAPNSGCNPMHLPLGISATGFRQIYFYIYMHWIGLIHIITMPIQTAPTSVNKPFIKHKVLPFHMYVMLTCRSLFLRTPTQKASWQWLSASMAFTRYTNSSRDFFSKGTWLVSPVSWWIYRWKKCRWGKDHWSLIGFFAGKNHYWPAESHSLEIIPEMGNDSLEETEINWCLPDFTNIKARLPCSVTCYLGMATHVMKLPGAQLQGLQQALHILLQT